MTFRGLLSRKSTLFKVLVWLFFILLFTGITITAWAVLVPDNESTGALKLLQVLQTFAVFIVPVLLAVYLWSDHPFHWLHMDRGFGWPLALLVPLMMVVFTPGINLLSQLNQQLTLPSFLSDLEALLRQQEEAAAALTERFARADNVPQLLLNLLIMAVLPAVGEEMAFRGTCQGLFPRGTERAERGHLPRQTHIAIWVTAILFSAIHLQFYGFVPRMLLGALLGYLLCWSGSLYLPMLAHCTNNAAAVCCYYMAEKGWVEEETIDTLGSGSTLWLGVLSLVLGSGLLWWTWRIAARSQSSGLPREASPAA